MPGGIGKDSIHAQMLRILASRRFATSERHSRLLRYLLEQTLEGRAGQLKEYALGMEVFERGDSFDPQTDPIVRTELSRLRAKLQDYYESDGREDALIVDLPKRSYSLTFRLREAPAVKATSKPALGWRAMAVATCLIVGLCGFWALGWASGGGARQEALRDDPTSIAVLPFVNLSADRESEHFSDGLTEELTHSLAEIDGLRVVSRTSAFGFKGKNQDLRTIAAQLNAELVLEGTVRRSGGRLRVTTRLVDATDGYELRSQVYERGVEDILAVQKEIARHLANAFRVHQRSGGDELTSSITAYRFYLEGRQHAEKRSELELRRAIDCYERAIDADRNYAPAHASLADAFILLALLNEAPPSEVMVRAKEAAQRAVKMGDALAQAHSALASVLSLYDRDWAGAEKEFRRALALGPNDPDVRKAYAMRYLAPLGRLNSALLEMQLAEGLDPFSPAIALNLGKVHHFRRDPDRAIKTFQRVSYLEPSFETAPLALAKAYVQKSLVQQALNTLQEASAPTEAEARLAILGHAYALSRQPELAQKALEQLREVSRHRYVSGYYFALIHLALGEKGQAIDWLERAAAERCPLIVYLNVNPLFDGLRAEPRFAALLRKAGLVGVSAPRDSLLHGVQ